MLTKKQVKEVREHLEKAQNPVFFFDNDPDGLCSFLLLQRYIGRGKGVAIKSFPEMTAEYFKRANELRADYIFILDKPLVSREFFEEARNFNIPIVWIDHHDVKREIPDFVYYYNPVRNRGKKNEPVTYLCYEIASRKEDIWLGVAGCIFDRYVPDFFPDFVKKYPELAVKSKDAFDILYKSQIGKVVRMFCFALKDKISNVVKMIKFLMTAKSPYDVLEESSKNKEMHARFRQIQRKYDKLMEKAKTFAGENRVLFFKYSGDLSISADLANELSYLYPDKIIVIVYVQGAKGNISVRGKKARPIVLEAIRELEGATAGGHEEAVGAKVRTEDLEKFKKKIENLSS